LFFVFSACQMLIWFLWFLSSFRWTIFGWTVFLGFTRWRCVKYTINFESRTKYLWKVLGILSIVIGSSDYFYWVSFVSPTQIPTVTPFATAEIWIHLLIVPVCNRLILCQYKQRERERRKRMRKRREKIWEREREKEKERKREKQEREWERERKYEMLMFCLAVVEFARRNHCVIVKKWHRSQSGGRIITLVTSTKNSKQIDPET
jgi:hypothetical protein